MDIRLLWDMQGGSPTPGARKSGKPAHPLPLFRTPSDGINNEHRGEPLSPPSSGTFGVRTPGVSPKYLLSPKYAPSPKARYPASLSRDPRKRPAPLPLNVANAANVPRGPTTPIRPSSYSTVSPNVTNRCPVSTAKDSPLWSPGSPIWAQQGSYVPSPLAAAGGRSPRASHIPRPVRQHTFSAHFMPRAQPAPLTPANNLKDYKFPSTQASVEPKQQEVPQSAGSDKSEVPEYLESSFSSGRKRSLTEEEIAQLSPYKVLFWPLSGPDQLFDPEQVVAQMAFEAEESEDTAGLAPGTYMWHDDDMEEHVVHVQDRSAQDRLVSEEWLTTFIMNAYQECPLPDYLAGLEPGLVWREPCLGQPVEGIMLGEEDWAGFRLRAMPMYFRVKDVPFGYIYRWVDTDGRCLVLDTSGPIDDLEAF